MSADAAVGNKIRVGILKFDSKASGVSDRQAEIITDLFTRTLASSKSISILERVALEKIGDEQRFNMSGLVDLDTAVEIGRIAGLQYILIGSVTELSQGAGASGFAIFANAKHEARATIDARVIDVTTSEIRLALSQRGGATNNTTAISIGGFTSVETEFGGLEARAIADAVSRLAHTLRGELGGEYSYVVSMDGLDIMIDVGSGLGVQPDTLYLAYADGKSILGINGELLGHDKIPLAVLKVRDTDVQFSTCTVAPPSKSGVIQRGDKIAPISASEAKSLADRKALPQKRPAVAASNSTMDALFGGAAPQAQTPQNTAQNAAEQNPAPESVPAQATQGSQPKEPASVPAKAELDPNVSTDAVVISTYPISSNEKNTLGIQHRGAWTLYSKKRYKEALDGFAKLVEDYPSCNYLSAYWAGMSALKIKNNKDVAAGWFDRAIEINPNYQPAIEERAKLK
jgi:TolA-binding protein